MLAAFVVVTLVGAWSYTQVRSSLREVRTAGLTSLLEVEARGLQLWIEERARDAELWAQTAPVREAGERLAAHADAGEACRDHAQRRLREQVAPYSALEGTSAFNLVGRDGRILAALNPRNCGLRVSEAFMKLLAPVFEGRTVFVRPLRETERLATVGAVAADLLTWAEAPVRAANGDVIAALGFGRPAAQRFADLLALSSSETTRDVYAFDEAGNLLTRSRFARELSAAGAGMLAARDPGGDLLAGFRPAEPLEQRPLTALAAAALDASAAQQGVLLEPYRNYRGTEVIGAWRRLPDSRMVVAVEIEASEAYAPLESLPKAFAVLLALVLIAMTAAASTSLWAVRLRMREAKRVGQYQLERQIGEGGMSNVYLARHALLKRPAAVKVLKSHLATDEVVTRFQREAQLCSQLSHPNTIEIHDYGATRDGRWYYAMEYLRGVSLETLVGKHGALPAARVVHLLRQACGSLREAHDRGWVHRDVKPSNVMVCASGGLHDVVKLVDFGLIKKVRGPHTRDITQYAKVLGTPLYMAPERLRNPADADARADIYALGAVAYYALVGKPAFEAATDHDIVYRVLNEPPPGLPAEAAGPLADLLAPLIASCLAKDREARPATIDAVCAVLDRAAEICSWTEDEARAWWIAHEASLEIPPADPT